LADKIFVTLICRFNYSWPSKQQILHFFVLETKIFVCQHVSSCEKRLIVNDDFVYDSEVSTYEY